MSGLGLGKSVNQKRKQIIGLEKQPIGLENSKKEADNKIEITFEVSRDPMRDSERTS